MTQKYDRFKDAPWFQQGVRPPVLIGGAGGIGSWLTVLLNRAGFETYIFDNDNLEAVNMAGQLFMHKSIGKSKVDALAEIVKELCQDDIIPNCEKVDETTMTNDIVFSAFDNMKAREDMFNTWLKQYKGNPKAIYIDGRLTAEQLTIFCVKGNDEKAILEYEKDHIFSDTEVEELPCTLKQTSHGAAMIAAHMVEHFTNWYAGILGKDTSRNAPFFWEYIIPIGYMSSRMSDNLDSSDKYDFKLPLVGNIFSDEEIEEARQRADQIILGETEEIKIDDFLNERGLPNPTDPNSSSAFDFLNFEDDATLDYPTANPLDDPILPSPTNPIDDLPF